MEWMVLEYPNTNGCRFYTKNGWFNPKHFIKIAEVATREEAQKIIWEHNPQMRKELMEINSSKAVKLPSVKDSSADMKEARMSVDELKADLSLINERKDYEKYAEMRALLSKNGIDVVHKDSCNLGRCYNSETFEVIAKQELPSDFILFLRKIGLLGGGQEFRYNLGVRRGKLHVYAATATTDSSD